jgi:polysaccharide export outer membrane protein
MAWLMVMLWTLLVGPAHAVDYKVGPGDMLEVHVYDEPELSGQVVVSDACTITLAMVPRVEVCDRTPDEIEVVVADAYRGDYLLHPSVSVRVVEFQSQRVDVLGEVGKPGPQYLTGTTSLLEVISLAGGPNENVAWVNVVRESGESERFAITLLSAGEPVFVGRGDKVFLESGGVVYVEGQIRKPGAVALIEGLTVTQALALAGGPDEFANVRRVLVRRATGEKVRVNVTRVNRGKEDDPMLAEDDYVVVPRSAI